MKRYKWFWILVAVFLLPVATAYAVDRLFLGPTCPACHAEITKKLPLFDPSREGLVRIRANGMEFRARVAGFSNHEGEGVILLHGFPETSIIWEALMDKLAKAGFRAVAFDQRGYSPGARPFGVNSYSSGRLAGDVIAIATAVGFDRFHVVGHDFGGAIAWIAARRLIPKRLPKSFERFQCPMSSYFLLYWIPVLPELALGFNRAAYLQRLKWELHPAKQIEEYKQVFSEAGASRSVLNWYRAFRFRSTDPLGKIRQPTLFLWGNEDEAFSHVAAVKTADHVEGPFRFYRLKAGHLLILELPELAADKVLSHLRTWSQESEEWKLVQANAPDESASSCDQSKPHCLSIFVAPDGNAVRI
jgi:pimeloyl-ACP methyl ester carboxylesterase